MACLWGDVLSKTNPGDTGPRRLQDSTLVRPRPRLIAHREPPNHRFHPQVLAVSVSLDPNGPQTRCLAHRSRRVFFSMCVNFFGLVRTLYRKPSGTRARVGSHFHLLTARVVLPRRPTRIASSYRSTVSNNLQQICSSLCGNQKCILRLTTPIQPTSAWFQH